MKRAARAAVGLALIAVALAGCASTTSTARAVVLAADHAIVEGGAAFGDFDLAHQRALLTAPDAAAKVAAYRLQQARVLAGFDGLRSASHAATASIAIADAGGDFTLTSLIAPLMDAARALNDAATAIGFTVPGLSAIFGKGG